MKSLVDALEAEAAKTKAEAKVKTAVPEKRETDGEAATKKSPPKSARRRSREFALQALYQWQVAAHSAGDLETQFSEADGFKRSDVTLFSVLMRGTIKESSTLIEQLTPHLDRAWVEVSPIERGILLMSSFELLHMPETPYRVIINEAIELAKSFGGTDGHKYVNGILDKLAATVRTDEITHQAANGNPVKKRVTSTPTVTVKARKVSKPE
jgi:transcription antitermination protein NusB